MNSECSLIRRSAVLVAAGTAMLVLAACGSSDDSSAGHDGHSSALPSASASTSAAQGQHNAADVAFAQRMIPHHRQAVEMADLASGRARSEEVRKLAADVRKAQVPEIRTLSTWLTSWDETVPSEGAVDHSTHGMDGMMSSADMDTLEKASGKAFDTAFLQMMIRHHEGAVRMAKTEQANGSSTPATKMAGQIITSQSAEIDTMNQLLGTS